jgi:uncharacterized protein YcaQ
MHPRELEAHLGRRRQLNAWGSYSKATTRCLEALHYRGLLRVAGREKGVRLYQAARQQHERLDPEERLRKLILLMARILAPVPDRSLRAALRLLARAAPLLTLRPSLLKEMIAAGDLASAEIEGVRYLWPAQERPNPIPEPSVRFLAPFDPIVWDRYRFEHLWGWAYRFEAYTPPPKRRMGYYAMPLLFGENVIGWVNVSGVGDQIEIQTGFTKQKPRDRLFRQAFEKEAERLKQFLTPRAIA